MSRDPAWPVYLVEAVPAGLEEVALGGDEGRHAASVRRHRVGEWLVATDGAGRWAAGPVGQVIGRDRLVIDVHLRGAEPMAEPALTVVQALPKSDRADAAVESLTAVGVDRIVPWQASRCVTRWPADRVDRGIRRWRRTAAEAAKQSRRVWLPEVTEPRDLTGVLTTDVVAAEAVFVCHERATTPLATAAVPRSGRIVLVIGPEGGLTDDEVTSLQQAGGRAVSLGPTVLRSTAAGMVAATLVLGAAGRLG